jgi:hypothetical protein
MRVSWFPPGPEPHVLVRPALDSALVPSAPIVLTFSRPVADILGQERPLFRPRVKGAWRAPNDHTLVFQPTGLGFPLGRRVHLRLPRKVEEQLAGVPVPEADAKPATQLIASLLRGDEASGLDVGISLYPLRPSVAGATDGGLGVSPLAALASSAAAAWTARVREASITVHGRPGPGAISGRHFRHGRNASASACAGESKKRQLRRAGVRTRQIGRQ